MTKRHLHLLERAFEIEVRDALTGGPGLLQARGKIVDELVKDDMLRRTKVTLPGRFPVVVEGYELTHAGRLAYCANCE